MSEGYSRSPKLLKGAIVQFTKTPIIPIPNIIIFQYNPESLSRSLTPYVPAPPPTGASASAQGQAGGGKPAAPETGASYDPTETFTVSLLLDASDALESPESHPVAFVTGVADRMAALEMLLYPVGDSLLGGLVGSLSASLSGGVSLSKDAFTKASRTEVPVTLFIWGPGRIVPVRLTSFTVEEQSWNQLLYPTRAKVSVGMKVLTDKSLGADPNSAQSGKDLAIFCYKFTRGQKELLALANIANTVESVLGILPF